MRVCVAHSPCDASYSYACAVLCGGGATHSLPCQNRTAAHLFGDTRAIRYGILYANVVCYT